MCRLRPAGRIGTSNRASNKPVAIPGIKSKINLDLPITLWNISNNVKIGGSNRSNSRIDEKLMWPVGYSGLKYEVALLETNITNTSPTQRLMNKIAALTRRINASMAGASTQRPIIIAGVMLLIIA
jgi:hypothetical protein